MWTYDKVYLIGNGRIADDCLKIIHNHRNDATLLIAEDEKFSFSQRFCERNGIPYLYIGKENIRDFLLSIEEKTLIISAHNGYLFPKVVVEKENIKIINMHIAPLPLYRGMNAPTWEIFEGLGYAGTTWHEVSAGIDAGGIIVQRTFAIGPHDTAMQVLQKSFHVGVELLEENVDDFLSGEYELTVPTEKTKLYLGKDIPNGGYMDPEWDIEKKYAFLRSMDYSGANIMPLPKVRVNGKVYEIWRYRLTEDQEDGSDLGQSIKYIAGDYCLICMLREVADQNEESQI